MSARRVLVVEDNPITRKMMRFALAAEGYEVLEAGDARTALDLCARGIPDLVVQDYVLPDIDGLHLLERFRALPGAAQTPVLLVTGMVSQLDELRKSATTATTFLPKPIEPSRLIEIVRSHLCEAAQSVGAGRRVLVVDDDPLGRKLALLRLRDAGFQVDSAADGEEALAKARAAPPDAVLCDVMMPGMDGFSVARAVRADPALSQLPVVLVSSAYVEDADRALALAMGAHSLLLRTPDMHAAVAALDEALGAGTRPAPPPTVPPLELEKLHQDRVRLQLEAQVAQNESLLRQSAIQSAALSVLRGLAGAMVRPEDLPSVLGDVLVHCLDATGLSTGLLYMLGADGSLRLRAQAGLPPAAAAEADDCFGDPQLLRATLDGGVPVAGSIAAPGPRGTQALARKLDKAFVLLIPFVVAEQRIGLMALAASTQNLTEPSWIGFGQALAAQFGQTIAVGQSLARGAASEARYRILMEHANDAILLMEPGRHVLEANREAEKLLGRSREEIVGHAYGEFVAPEERADAYVRNERLWRDGSDRVQNRLLLRADGSRVAVDVSVAMVRVGEQTVALAILRDVTERNRAEALALERERLATFTAEVSAALVHDEPLPSVLRRCCQAAVRHLDAAFARIWMLDAAENVLVLQASAGLYTHLDGPHGRVPVGSFKIGLIAAEMQPHLTNAVVGDPRVGDQEWARREGMVAFAGYPMAVGGRVVGVVAMFARQALSENVLRALGAVADQIALAIERKRAQEALRESEKRVRHLVGANPAIIYALRLVPGTPPSPTWVSENIERQLGYAPAQATTHDWWAGNVHPEDFPRVSEYFRTMLAETDQWTQEYRFRDKAGRYHWLRDEQRLLRDAAGTPLEIVGSWVDVSDRKAAEMLLDENERQYRLLFDGNPQPMWVYDTHSLEFLAVNQAATRSYGYTLEEFQRMTIRDIRPPEELPALEQRLSEVDEGVAALGVTRVWTHRRKDGGLRQVEVTSAPITFAGRSARLVLANDVTEKRSLEAQLAQAQKMESVGRLAGGVAHDFNNLLGVITGYGELLRRRLAEPKLKKYSEDILQAADRAAGLTRQLLAFSRRQVLQPRVLDLNGVVADVEKMLRRLIGEDVGLKTSLGREIGTVRADKGQLEQVLMNLAVNARDAMPRGGEITIQTAGVELDAAYARRHEGVTQGRYVMLAVSDTGHGMTPEVRARIFEPFFTTKTDGKGTGLGLATVYGIVKQSEGHISVRSEPGQGTTFEVYLPRVESAAAEPSAAKAPATLPRGSETILLVEDELALRELVRECLEDCGYAVIDARHGEEALERARAHAGSIELLMTDVVMPGLGGRDLAQRLAGTRPGLRVLYMSGYTNDAVMHHGVLSEQMAFLQKPFTQEALARKVREALDAPPVAP